MTQAAKRLDGREHFFWADLDRQQELVIQAQRRIALAEALGGLPAAQKTDLVTTFSNQASNFFFQPWFVGWKKTKYQAA
jgi:hypothetical protein